MYAQLFFQFQAQLPDHVPGIKSESSSEEQFSRRGIKGRTESSCRGVFPEFVEDAVLQIWDRDFEEFLDIEEERIPGPAKVRVNQVIPTQRTKIGQSNE